MRVAPSDVILPPEQDRIVMSGCDRRVARLTRALRQQDWNEFAFFWLSCGAFYPFGAVGFTPTERNF